MKSWQDNLINFDELVINSEIKLRHDFEQLFISSLASQLYCEKKLEFDIKYKPEPTAEQKLGTEIHEELIPVEPVEAGKLVNDIEAGKEVVSIFPVFYQYQKISIAGIHDGVVFENSKPRYLFEIKSTGGKLDKVWPGEKFQAFLYGFALEKMGFDTSELEIVIPKVKQSIEKEGLINPILYHLKNKSIHKFHLENPKIRLHIFDFSQKNKSDIIIQLNELVKFWKKEREAEGSRNLAKCGPCSYRDECDYYQIRKP